MLSDIESKVPHQVWNPQTIDVDSSILSKLNQMWDNLIFSDITSLNTSINYLLAKHVIQR